MESPLPLRAKRLGGGAVGAAVGGLVGGATAQAGHVLARRPPLVPGRVEGHAVVVQALDTPVRVRDQQAVALVHEHPKYQRCDFRTRIGSAA